MDQLISGMCPVAGGQSGFLLNGVLSFMVGMYCGLSNPLMWPQDNGPRLMQNDSTEYDFIVIGSGSAGSVVANRLSEMTDWRILLIEAGDIPPPDSQIPALTFNLQRTKVDWGYETEFNPSYCQGMKTKKCYWPRGKLLGGSSAINALLYVRGNRDDYNEWDRNGNTGWNYNSILSYFKKSEKINDKRILNDKNLKQFHGTDGVLNVEDFPTDDQYYKDIIKSGWKQLNKPISDDINGNSQMGIFESQGTIMNGERFSTAASHLRPVQQRDNLDVLYNSYVSNIIIDENTKTATGVKVRIGNLKEIKLKATKEVIVSAGTINSPQILMLSGIGPQKHLKEMGIKVVKDLPVGENLQDHIYFPMYFKTKKNIQPEITANYILNMGMQYFLTRRGPLGSVGIGNLIGFINSLDDKSEIPDLQFHHTHFKVNDSTLLPAIFHAIGYNDEILSKLSELTKDGDVFQFLPTLLKPKSRGYIRLKNSDPYEKPLIYANYLSDLDDLETLMRGSEFVQKLEQTAAFKDANFELVKLDIKECADQEFKTPAYWKCIIKNMMTTTYHPTGTVKMGPESDKMAVVDPRLRVYGIKNLRVIDASIMPNIVRGNTHAPTMMIGERGAFMIREDWIIKKKNSDEL